MDQLNTVAVLAAEQIKDIFSLKLLFPFLVVMGGGAFLYFGFKGIFKKRTILLLRTYSALHRNDITGNTAVIFGLTYILIGIPLTIFLGMISYYMWI